MINIPGVKWDPIGDIKKGAQNLYDDTVGKDSWIGSGQAGGDLLNTAIQYGSLGLAGYDAESGTIKTGFSGDVIRDTGAFIGSGLKDITGATAAEQAIELQKQQIALAKTEAERIRADQIAYRQRQDIAASNAAGGFASIYSSGNPASSSFYNPGDLLGA